MNGFCLRCGEPAYIGLACVDCTNPRCRHHRSLLKIGIIAAEKVEALWAEVEGLENREDIDRITAEIRKILGAGIFG